MPHVRMSTSHSLNVRTRLVRHRAQIVSLLVPVLVLLCGAAIRIASRPKRDFDERLFLNVAQHIVGTGLPTDSFAFPGQPYLFFDHTPLYVYALAVITALGGPTVLLARGTSLLFALLTVIVVHRIGLRVRGPGAAFVGALLVASSPFFVTYAWFIRMEVPLCFFLVLAVYLLHMRRFGLAGLAIAVALMLKELALLFWLVTVVFVLVKQGRRETLMVAAPAPIALVAWLAYAATLDVDQLLRTLGRWGTSAVGSDPTNRRFHIGPLSWAGIIMNQVLGPVLVFATGATAALLATRPIKVPAIAAVPAIYALLAVAASFAMSLKEPRYLVVVVPMLALTVALAVDWDRAIGEAWTRARGAARVRRRGGARGGT